MSEANTLDCGDVRELIPDLVAGRLPADQAARVQSHMATCADCRAELDLVRLLHATRADVPADLLDRITRASIARRPARTWWGISAAAIAALALGIGIVSDDASAPGAEPSVFVREAEEGEIWLSDDGLVAGAPALDELSDEALLELLDELTNVSTGGGA
jgi:anti-sigma factor RsiW